MDWLKKWFSSQENLNERKQETDNSQTVNKDIEARIVYQYPKINYQIPDLEVERKPRKKRDGRTYSTEIARQDMEMPIEQSTTRRQRRAGLKNDTELEGNGDKEDLDTPAIKRRPFRPTNIPSPIYGYNSRKKEVETPVEFELSTFLNHTQENDTVLPTFENSEEQSNYNLQERDHSAINSFDKEFSYYETGIDQSDKAENRDELPIYNNILQTDPIENESLVEHCKQQNDYHDVTHPDPQNEAYEVNKVTSLTENESFRSRESDPLQAEINEEKDEQPKRKHIPFNVMMLKKDREYLKQQPVNVHKVFDSGSPQNSGEQKQVQLNNVTTLEKADNQTNAINDVISIPKINQDGYGSQQNAHVQQTDKGNNDRQKVQYHYEFAPRTLLRTPVQKVSNDMWLRKQAEVLDHTLSSFNVGAKVVGFSEGPSVTRFEVSPDLGVKVNKITNLTDDLKLSLAARDIRIEAPIPGKHTVGIEVPNKESRPVYIREILDTAEFIHATSPLTVALGLDITGKPVLTDLKKMPHGLIAGATGSGKSVCINTFIVSLLYKARPDEVKLLLIDPKMVELAPYNEIPHLISPVITNVKAATAALKWAVEEMERRYELFAALGVRDIGKYNEKDDTGEHHLPYIVIIIDELADLMMVSPADVEESIARIAQKARACGIHLLVATQRPSVDVITGLIKANVPTRIAFSVSSQVDSRTIIDISGAERLLGKGDMLFLDNGSSKPVRLQGPFISDEEIEKVVEHVRGQGKPHYLFEQEDLIKKTDFAENDDLLFDACEFAVQQGNISTSSLQRHFRIGYNRAARLIELMEEKGLITESKGSKPRDVLMTEQDLEELQEYL